MPAIQPARMKIQVAQLGEKARQPEVFVRELHGLLDFYADRTHRAGQFGEPPPLLATYKTPAPVFRQIEREIAPLADDPPAALALVDALWAEKVLEFRQLAIRLLGLLPPTPPQAVLERVSAWIAAYPENRIQEAILEHSLARLRREAPQYFYPLVESWLTAEAVYSRQAGLRALSYLVGDPGYENIPAVFRLTLPWMRSIPAALRQEMVTLMRALARHFPQEASYILRQNLADDRPDTIWLARQVLDELPDEIQAGLRDTLRPYQR
jgi:hypothetical protein